MIAEKAQYYIDQFAMLKHPEGGWYKETYRAKGIISGSELEGFGGDRSYSTAIYFLLTNGNPSVFHRIKADEAWHFYDGDGILIHELDEAGRYTEHRLGLNLEEGEEPQLVIKGKSWFASEVVKENGWCLVGCTVAPGFDFEDFEMAERRILIEQYPEHSELISRLTNS